MKILIADDHELFLQGLEFILKKEYPAAKVESANNYLEIFDRLTKDKGFDLIITDLAMPGANWHDALGKIHEMCPETPIVIISAVFEKEILQKTFDIGVSGYISKTFSNNLIISAINLVLAGGVYIPPEILQVGAKASPEPINSLMKDLEIAVSQDKKEITKKVTPRQLEVLQCISEGMSNKQIAYKLGLSEGTVKIHITLLMRALDVNNRVSAVLEATKQGLIKNVAKGIDK